MSSITPTIKSVTDNARIGVKLRSLRIKKGLKMKWVGNQIGCSESMISYLEHGKRTWTEALEQKYLKAIGEL